MGETSRGRRSSINWTDQMIFDLLQCKLTAKEWVNEGDPRCYQRGRKMGYMELMKNLWEERGYELLGLSAQNLRDKAAHAEKCLGNVDKERVDCSGRRNIGSTLSRREDVDETNLQAVNGATNLVKANEQTQPNTRFSQVTQICIDEQKENQDYATTASPSGPLIPKRTIEKSPSQIQPNLPDYNVFPSEIKEKM